MKNIIMAVCAALMLTISFNAGAGAKDRCCKDKTECKSANADCCKSDAACCKEGAACCKSPASASTGNDCCKSGADCCKPGAKCCDSHASKTAVAKGAVAKNNAKKHCPNTAGCICE